MRNLLLLTAALLWVGVAVTATVAGDREAPANDPSSSHILEITDAIVLPNPFNPLNENTRIEFTLSRAAEVEITAYDWNGEYVDTVLRASGPLGPNAAFWGGQTEDGRKLGNGVYLIRIVAWTQARTESVVLKVAVWSD